MKKEELTEDYYVEQILAEFVVSKKLMFRVGNSGLVCVVLPKKNAAQRDVLLIVFAGVAARGESQGRCVQLCGLRGAHPVTRLGVCRWEATPWDAGIMVPPEELQCFRPLPVFVTDSSRNHSQA